MGWLKRLNTKITNIETKISSVTSLVTTSVLNTKTAKIGSKIPNFTILATNVALNIKATEIGKEVTDSNHFVNAQKFNRLTKISFDEKVKEASKSVASKSKVDNALDLGDKNREKYKNLKHLFDSSYFFGESYFKYDNGTENYLMFQPV